MTTTASPKQAALELIASLPDDVSLEDIMYRLYVLQRIERGIREADKGQIRPHDEVMREARKWLKSGGRRART